MADDKTRIDFDHHSPEFASDHLGTYAKLRSRCPVAHTDRHGGYWVVAKYDDVATVARDDATFSSDHDPDGTRTDSLPNPKALTHRKTAVIRGHARTKTGSTLAKAPGDHEHASGYPKAGCRPVP